MSSGLLKIAVGASLAIHAAGFGVIAYVQLPRHPAAVIPADAPFVMTITAVPDDSADAETVSLSPPPAPPPVEPVVPAKPEPVVTPPPDPAPVSEPPKPVVLQPEPPVMLMPDLFSMPPSATAAPSQPVSTASAQASDAKEFSTAPASAAQRGERIVTRAHAGYRKNSERFYPPEAIRQHEEGLVIVTADVDTQGFPRNVELKESSGHPLLDDAAIRAVQSWEFEPARLDGRPIVSTVEVPVNFKLSN